MHINRRVLLIGEKGGKEKKEGEGEKTKGGKEGKEGRKEREDTKGKGKKEGEGGREAERETEREPHHPHLQKTLRAGKVLLCFNSITTVLQSYFSSTTVVLH